MLAAGALLEAAESALSRGMLLAYDGDSSASRFQL
jgi:hypothetical protein